MKTLVLYASKYGTAKSLAETIAAKMPGEATALPIGKQIIDLGAVDTVILGTSVYMGKPRKEMKVFVRENLPVLLQRKIGLFLSCLLDEDSSVTTQFQNAFPKELRDHADCLAALGGAVDRERLNKLEGFIMRMVAARLPNDGRVISNVAEERIDQLVEKMTFK